MKLYLTAFLAPVAVFAAIGVMAIAAPDKPHRPTDVHSVTVEGLNCPTEDSCVVDYSDGKWRITEVTP